MLLIMAALLPLSVYLCLLLFVVKVCDARHSELIPCLDRNLIYQLRLKLDLNLMEHYERHCPPADRRYNCLIPPPPGYQVKPDTPFECGACFSLFLFVCEICQIPWISRSKATPCGW